MNRRLLLWLLVVLAGATAASVYADGVFMPTTLSSSPTRPSSAAQKGILIKTGRDEILLLQTTYQGPADQFAWIIPVPSVPAETFAAEPAFITETFRGTEPVVVTNFGHPAPSTVKSAREKAAPPAAGMAGGPGGGEEPPVRVVQELNVGDYHAVVLSARAGDALQQWLAEHHYAVPAAAATTVADYARRGWVFVALKMQEQRVRAQPVLTDVAPLGLRFRCPAQGMVYPLTVSRLSAPPFSAILLCTIADAPHTCATLPVEWIKERVTLGRDETYGHLRRRLTREPTRLLCEFSGNPPFHYTNLSYRASDWEQGRNGGFYTWKASRFFGLLTPAEMTDLFFQPDPDPTHTDVRLLIQRQAPELDSRRLGALRMLRMLVPGSSEQKAAMAQPATVATLATSPTHVWGEHAPRGHRAAEPVVYLALGVLLTIFLIVVLSRPRRPGPPVTLLVLLLGLGLLAGRGWSGLPGLGVLDEVQRAADLFAEDTGCLPLTAADLAARQQPAEGLDPSGNRVALRGWRGPYLNYIPPEVLPHGPVVCDPLNLFGVDATGFDTTCEATTFDLAQRATGSGGHGLRAYWSASPGGVKKDMAAYVGWLQGRRGHHLTGFAATFAAMRADSVMGVVVDRDAKCMFPITGRHCLVGPGGLVLSTYSARQEAATVQAFSGLTDFDHAFRLLPRAPQDAGLLAMGPDGSTLVSAGGALTLLRPDGGTRRYRLAGDASPNGAAFLRDGKTVYLWSNALWRLDLNTGAVRTCGSGVAEESIGERVRPRPTGGEPPVAWAPSSGIAAGPDGVAFAQGQQILYVGADGTAKLLVNETRGHVRALAVAQDYVYWAVTAGSSAEDNTIYRVTLGDKTIKAVAHFRYQRPILFADAADLYLAHESDYSLSKITLLANGTQVIHLSADQNLSVPANLPTLE